MTNKIPNGATWARDEFNEDTFALLVELCRLDGWSLENQYGWGLETYTNKSVRLDIGGCGAFANVSNPSTHTLMQTVLMFAPDWAVAVVKIYGQFYWADAFKAAPIDCTSGAIQHEESKTILTLDRSEPKEWKPQVGEVCKWNAHNTDVKVDFIGSDHFIGKTVDSDKEVTGYLQDLKPLPQKSARDLAVEEMLSYDCEPHEGMLSRRDFCGVLHEKGYRQVSREKLEEIADSVQEHDELDDFVDALCEHLDLGE